jgi:membrane-associated phospholipid phosphatase
MRNRPRRSCTIVFRAACIAISVTLGGCAATTSRHWGADATWHPGLQRLRESAIDSATSPRVWLPLAGAAVFQINGWDRKVSNWARENTPVFGSEQSAKDWSDYLRTASSVAYFSTVVFTPGSDEVGPWIREKSQGLLVGLGAIAVTGATTTGLKSLTDRTRPNGENTESFPSGHTSHSAVLTGLAHDNLAAIDMRPGTRFALETGLDALTLGTAWARVEAGAHFPSDTLVGMALGNFVSRCFDEAFLGSEGEQRGNVTVTPSRHGLSLRWELAF